MYKFAIGLLMVSSLTYANDCYETINSDKSLKREIVSSLRGLNLETILELQNKYIGQRDSLMKHNSIIEVGYDSTIDVYKVKYVSQDNVSFKTEPGKDQYGWPTKDRGDYRTLINKKINSVKSEDVRLIISDNLKYRQYITIPDTKIKIYQVFSIYGLLRARELGDKNCEVYIEDYSIKSAYQNINDGTNLSAVTNNTNFSEQENNAIRSFLASSWYYNNINGSYLTDYFIMDRELGFFKFRVSKPYFNYVISPLYKERLYKDGSQYRRFPEL